MITYKPGQKGFTLFELLVSLVIIATLWGFGLSVAPRLLTGVGPDALARRLAGSGQEARQMALLQQRPWELLLDLDEGVFYRSPLNAVHRRELRAAGLIRDESREQAEREERMAASREMRPGETRQEDLVSRRREELEEQQRPATDTLRVIREYDRLAFGHGEMDSDIHEVPIPDGVRIIQVWRQGGRLATEGRISLVFGPRGFVQPTAIWLENADSPGKGLYTVYFSGIIPPVVASGLLLPDDSGALVSADMP